jgi:hypothetical protein
VSDVDENVDGDHGQTCGAAHGRAGEARASRKADGSQKVYSDGGGLFLRAVKGAREATMVTSRMLGVFRNHPETRQEFLSAIDLRGNDAVRKGLVERFDIEGFYSSIC